MTWTARLLYCACLFSLVTSIPAVAEEQTVVLTIPKMTKPECQITVAKALRSVDGVSKVTAAYATKRAYITFDDRVADVGALKQATAEAGYPATESVQAEPR